MIVSIFWNWEILLMAFDLISTGCLFMNEGEVNNYFSSYFLTTASGSLFPIVDF